jgi:hypothetical protein
MKIVFGVYDITNNSSNLIYSASDLTSVYIKAMSFLEAETHKTPSLSAIKKEFKEKVNAEYNISHNEKTVKITKTGING